MRGTAAVLAVCAACAGFCASTETIVFDKGRTGVKKAQAMMRLHGGLIETKESLQGKIVIVDERDEADTRQLAEPLANFHKINRYRIDVLARRADGAGCKEKLAALGAQVGVFVVSDDTSPTLLVAPEDGWAVVNARTLVRGVEKSRLAPLRIQKEVMRALGFVCGGHSSQFAESLARAVTKPSDLDLVADAALPYDVMASFRAYLEAFGVTPYKTQLYDKACQEGWAPAPTNDVQKAIWDKVHATPKTPIKIEFDPKKGR